MMTMRPPSGEMSASYSSPGVLIAGPRFSSSHSPRPFERARQMSVFPSPPGRLEPK